jgi:type IV pilus assembly protein PilC
MSRYTFTAVDVRGKGTQGTLQATDQSEALERIKEMGFFPTRVAELRTAPEARARQHGARLSLKSRATTAPVRRKPGRVKQRQVAVFTRQLATLVESGMPLLRSLRLLEEQEESPAMKSIISNLSESIEGGSSLSEGLSQAPKAFDRLYLNMVKAGEISGALEICLLRLAQFMEKNQRIKGRVKSAMIYPAIVITVALLVVTGMLIFVVPRFETVFKDLNGGRELPAFTTFVLNISYAVKHNFLYIVAAAAALWTALFLGIRTQTGRRLWDGFKLRMPIVGKLFRKLAIARFTRTLGTLVSSGVPILQGLGIVKEAVGNVAVGEVVGRVHDNVEQGESIVGPLRASGIFPAMVAGMVDVGEQTGSLPEMLNRIADIYDEEVDNSVAGLTSMLEPLLIVFLALVVGCIVVAMFAPLCNFGPADSSDANI